jgi:ElaB/YqjD/DUF883 family membrane-anchored ribosome-binding protein
MSATNEARAHDDGLDGSEISADSIKQRLKERADELIDDGRAAVGNAGSKMRGQVRERPLTSLVVAGSVGLLVGLLIGRKI